jgi:hypothetical protein
MADSFNEETMVEDAPRGSAADIEMAEGETGAASENPNAELPFAEGGPEDAPAPRTTFLQYLTSPVVTLLVGSGENETILTAHQGLLTRSPFFAEACAEFVDDGSVRQSLSSLSPKPPLFPELTVLRLKQPRQIELPGEDLDAMGCFLEFLYTGDYFPRKVPGQRTLEKDPSIPEVDMTGEQLLKHAKVYTLADKFGLTHLKNLASSKIHCVNSTAKGEIAYARYVYQYTPPTDTAIRVPVANFWATRSHTLRAEAEDEFRDLCLQFPQFGYDVLSKFSCLPLCRVLCVVRSANGPLSLLLQPACSTTSSSASATRRCTPAPPAARASGPATAALPRRRSRNEWRGREREAMERICGRRSRVLLRWTFRRVIAIFLRPGGLFSAFEA